MTTDKVDWEGAMEIARDAVRFSDTMFPDKQQDDSFTNLARAFIEQGEELAIWRNEARDKARDEVFAINIRNAWQQRAQQAESELSALRSRVARVVGEMRVDATKLHALGNHTDAWALEARADELEGKKP